MKKLMTLCCLAAMLVPFSLNAATSYKYSFSQEDDFKVDFADYPKDQEAFYELQSQQNASLPPEIATKMPGLKIVGNNHSDDLFMYAYKKISGLKPNTTYQVNFSLEFASNAPKNGFGVGGSPGSSIYIKIGVLPEEPKRILDRNNYYRMALDKGNQKQDGKDLILIGTIGVETADNAYQLKTLPYQPNEEMQSRLKNYRVTANEKGEAWVILGSDSGYESLTTLFFTNLVVSFLPIQTA